MLQICFTDGEMQWSAGMIQIPFFDNARKKRFFFLCDPGMILSSVNKFSLGFIFKNACV